MTTVPRAVAEFEAERDHARRIQFLTDLLTNGVLTDGQLAACAVACGYPVTVQDVEDASNYRWRAAHPDAYLDSLRQEYGDHVGGNASDRDRVVASNADHLNLLLTRIANQWTPTHPEAAVLAVIEAVTE